MVPIVKPPPDTKRRWLVSLIRCFTIQFSKYTGFHLIRNRVDDLDIKIAKNVALPSYDTSTSTLSSTAVKRVIIALKWVIIGPLPCEL